MSDPQDPAAESAAPEPKPAPATPDTASVPHDDAASGQAEGRHPDPRLLEILVCPVTRSSLTYDRANQELISKAARLAYPIRDGIPIMLPEEARELDDEA